MRNGTGGGRNGFDVAVIGAGVVGCAVARRLTLAGARVVVLERAAEVLDGASKANSAILHTGFDAPPGSLEQRLVAFGHAEFMRLHEELGLPVLREGAMVLAWTAEQVAALDGLMQKAQVNGVGDVRALSRAEILRREPNLSPAVRAGFEVPREYLVDPWATAHAYLLQALANGAVLMREAEVLSGDFDGRAWHLETARGRVTAGEIVACAGLYGDELDRRLTGSAEMAIHPRKGQFLVFDKTAAATISSILLPVPSARTKGIVLCRTIFGNVLVGPTAEEQESRSDASTDRATLQMLREAAMSMVPGLAGHEITTAYAGLRPASDRPEYRIRDLPERHYLSLGGIRSTGLSASLGLAEHVMELRPGLAAGEPPRNPVVPLADRLSDYHPRDWQSPDHGEILCHCERVTRREVERVLAGPMAPRTLAGLKRRSRVCMGRCQGFYCGAAVARLLAAADRPAETGAGE